MSISNFLCDEYGGLTVESVLWVPIYAGFLVLIVEASLLFNAQSQIQRTVQDVNRLASNGFLASSGLVVDEDEVEAKFLATISHLSTDARVSTNYDPATRLITTEAVVPSNDLIAVGTITKFVNLPLTFVAQHVVER